MNTPTHDFVTVDMRGLKAPLVALSRAKKVTVSVVVRGAVARELQREVGAGQTEVAAADGAVEADRGVKFWIRVSAFEAARLNAGAKAAGLSRGAYLVGLADEVPVLKAGGSRPETITALIGSCAELSTLSRNIHQLTALLREGNVRQAMEYRDTLDGVVAEVRGHLKQATATPSLLRSARVSRVATGSDKGQRRRPWAKE